ncbi:UcrQ-domain-containing protein [Decorospora gaudefroyi]|uniref:Cytochrome b-c1 complex subunit 8 n=1 Tax=Decorospora gaudefroyi TaxID=184978 RepID=A0A6A5KGQ2_9PLEO|nr:UcrQ-domain-containing protein [Decorospora gaudefroyi]
MGSGPSPNSKTKTTWHIGSWGNPYEGGGRPGKGIITYSLSPNRQRPMATFINKGFWNVVRRSRAQILYFAPPMIIAYSTMQWAIEKNEFYNSKQGRALFGDEE